MDGVGVVVEPKRKNQALRQREPIRYRMMYVW
jgi:hypothetical protein